MVGWVTGYLAGRDHALLADEHRRKKGVPPLRNIPKTNVKKIAANPIKQPQPNRGR